MSHKTAGRERRLLVPKKQQTNANMSVFRTRVPVVYAFALALFGATAAHAASRDKEEHACRGDALRLCMADVPNKARITECMKQHYDQLSPPCKSMFDAPNARGRSKRAAPASGAQ